MVLIFAIAGTAAAVIRTFNKMPVAQRTALMLVGTQVSTVIIAITTAVQWIMQGLQGLTRLASPPIPGYSSQPTTVGRPASVAVAA